MDFNSPIFLFFFLPIFMLVYHFLPLRGKLIFGILGSLLFYAWGNLEYVALMLGLVLVSYGLALGIDHWRGKKAALWLLTAGIVAIVGLIIGFKLWKGIPYPLGLSYVSFQIMAYWIEVYRKLVPRERNLLIYSFYVLLFPKIPVGPIVRYGALRAQIAELHIDPATSANGFRRFARGLGKKVLIANTLAAVVNPIFSLAAPTISPGWAWLVLLSYALQIFFDFSGYTDMAIGLGQMMGLRFMENFNFPYLARSIGDFWRRWHISLSSWFRDFVFYPLERRRLKWVGQPLNTLIVFVLVGLWHGLSLNFILWGALHGAALVFEATPAGRWLLRLRLPVRHAYTLAVVLLGWVFFRSPTPGFAIQFAGRLLGNTAGVTQLPFTSTSPLPFIEPTFVLAFILGLLLCFPIGPFLQKTVQAWAQNRPTAIQISTQLLYDAGTTFTVIACVAATVASGFLPSIYGKF